MQRLSALDYLESIDMSHFPTSAPSHPWASRRYRTLATMLLLCGTIGLGACSSPDPAVDTAAPSEEVTAAPEPSGNGDIKQSRRAEASFKRLANTSAKLYNSAYRTDWEKSAQQITRLQKIGDRIDTLSINRNSVIDSVDVEALLLQLTTLEDAIVAEQQVPAMVAANQLSQMGIQATQTVNPEAEYLPMAQLAHHGRQLELATLGPDGAPSGSLAPEQVEAMNQAAEQVIQAWDSLSAAAPGAVTADDAAALDDAVSQLRQAPVDDYSALARQIAVEAQNGMTNRRE